MERGPTQLILFHLVTDEKYYRLHESTPALLQLFLIESLDARQKRSEYESQGPPEGGPLARNSPTSLLHAQLRWRQVQ